MNYYATPENEIVAVNYDDVVSFYTLNTWTDDKKEEVRKSLNDGRWIHLGSSALGHTRAAMTERDGLNWLDEEYGDDVCYGRCWLGVCAALRKCASGQV